MIALEEIEVIGKRLREDRNALAVDDDLRASYTAVIDKLDVLGHSLRLRSSPMSR